MGLQHNSIGLFPLFLGLHTLQWLSGSDLLSDGSVRRTLQCGYNRQDFISFA